MDRKESCELRDNLKEKALHKLFAWMQEEAKLIALPFGSGKFSEQRKKMDVFRQDYEKALEELINHRVNDNC